MAALRKSLLLGSVLVLLAGCNSRTEKGDRTVRTGNISFAHIQEAILKPSCLGCHGSSQAPFLVSYEQVKANLSAIERAVVVQKSMPKRGPLPESEISLLQQWIANGAPELAGSAPPILPPPTERPIVAWKELQKKVIQPKCMACHFKDNPDKISDLEDEETFRTLVGSILFLSVANSTMPPPPKDTPEGAANPNQLSRQEKETLAYWVIDGLKKE